MTRDVVMGATGAGTSSEMGPILYNSLLGTRFKLVGGYSGAEEINDAMKRGEIDGRANSTWASIKLTLLDEFKDGKVNVLIQMGLRKEKELPRGAAAVRARRRRSEKRSHRQVHVPVGDGRATARRAARRAGRARGILLRRAFDATMVDPEFLGRRARSAPTSTR